MPVAFQREKNIKARRHVSHVQLLAKRVWDTQNSIICKMLFFFFFFCYANPNMIFSLMKEVTLRKKTKRKKASQDWPPVLRPDHPFSGLATRFPALPPVRHPFSGLATRFPAWPPVLRPDHPYYGRHLSAWLDPVGSCQSCGLMVIALFPSRTLLSLTGPVTLTIVLFPS